jgi:hypothetical protein
MEAAQAESEAAVAAAGEAERMRLDEELSPVAGRRFTRA